MLLTLPPLLRWLSRPPPPPPPPFQSPVLATPLLNFHEPPHALTVVCQWSLETLRSHTNTARPLLGLTLRGLATGKCGELLLPLYSALFPFTSIPSSCLPLVSSLLCSGLLLQPYPLLFCLAALTGWQCLCRWMLGIRPRVGPAVTPWEGIELPFQESFGYIARVVTCTETHNILLHYKSSYFIQP